MALYASHTCAGNERPTSNTHATILKDTAPRPWAGVVESSAGVPPQCSMRARSGASVIGDLAVVPEAVARSFHGLCGERNHRLASLSSLLPLRPASRGLSLERMQRCVASKHLGGELSSVARLKLWCRHTLLLAVASRGSERSDGALAGPSALLTPGGSDRPDRE